MFWKKFFLLEIWTAKQKELIQKKGNKFVHLYTVS